MWPIRKEAVAGTTTTKCFDLPTARQLRNIRRVKHPSIWPCSFESLLNIISLTFSIGCTLSEPIFDSQLSSPLPDDFALPSTKCNLRPTPQSFSHRHTSATLFNNPATWMQPCPTRSTRGTISAMIFCCTRAI